MDANKGIELPPGTKISFYEVLPAVTGEHGDVVRTCIGYGGFGALYRVSRGSKVFALKLAHQPLSAYSTAERQWVEERGDREIATLKSLRHPNIVRVHAFDNPGNQHMWNWIPELKSDKALAASVQVISPNQVNAKTPAGEALGFVDVSVSVGAEVQRLDFGFEYIPNFPDIDLDQLNGIHSEIL